MTPQNLGFNVSGGPEAWKRLQGARAGWSSYLWELNGIRVRKTVKIVKSLNLNSDAWNRVKLLKVEYKTHSGPVAQIKIVCQFSKITFQHSQTWTHLASSLWTHRALLPWATKQYIHIQCMIASILSQVSEGSEQFITLGRTHSSHFFASKLCVSCLS